MKMTQFFVRGLVSLVYIILLGPIAYSGAELWTDILFGEITSSNAIALYWSYAFYYIFIMLVIIVPAVGIYGVVLKIKEEESIEKGLA